MNKQYLAYSVLMISLLVSNLSFSMHNLIFRGTQLVSEGYCIGRGLKEAYDRKKLMTQVPTLLKPIPEHEPIHEFVELETKRLNVPKKQLYYGSGWASINNALLVPYDFCERLKLNHSVKKKLDSLRQERDCMEKDIQERKNLTWFGSISSTIPKDDERAVNFLDSDIHWYQNKLIEHEKKNACGEFALGHEIGHCNNEDTKGKTYAHIAMPIVVQGVCSSITHSFNKCFGIKSPRTVLHTIGRSSLAAGSIPLKITLDYLGMSFYARYQEKRADVYSCKNAKGRLALEEAYKDLQNNYIQFNEDVLSNPEQFIEVNAKGIFQGSEISAIIMSKQLGNLNGVDDKDSKWLRVAHFICDPKHPYFTDRIDMIKKYRDEKRKETSS